MRSGHHRGCRVLLGDAVVARAHHGGHVSVGRVLGHERSGCEVAAEEVPDLLPAVVGGRDVEVRAVDAEERVPGVLVGVELVLLAVRLERRGDACGLLRRRVAVVGTEQPEQRARQPGLTLDHGLRRSRDLLGAATTRPP